MYIFTEETKERELEKRAKGCKSCQSYVQLWALSLPWPSWQLCEAVSLSPFHKSRNRHRRIKYSPAKYLTTAQSWVWFKSVAKARVWRSTAELGDCEATPPTTATRERRGPRKRTPWPGPGAALVGAPSRGRSASLPAISHPECDQRACQIHQGRRRLRSQAAGVEESMASLDPERGNGSCRAQRGHHPH